MGHNLSKNNAFRLFFGVVSVSAMSSHHYPKHVCKSTKDLRTLAHVHTYIHTLEAL